MAERVFDPTRKSTTPLHGLLQKMTSHDGKEWVYLQADGAVQTGRVVTIGITGQADRAADAADYGPLAVAAQDFADNEYGWFQVYGACQLDADGDVSAGDDISVDDGTDGEVTATATADSLIIGARVGARTGAGLVDAFIVYPAITHDTP